MAKGKKHQKGKKLLFQDLLLEKVHRQKMDLMKQDQGSKLPAGRNLFTLRGKDWNANAQVAAIKSSAARQAQVSISGVLFTVLLSMREDRMRRPFANAEVKAASQE